MFGSVPPGFPHLELRPPPRLLRATDPATFHFANALEVGGDDDDDDVRREQSLAPLVAFNVALRQPGQTVAVRCACQDAPQVGVWETIVYRVANAWDTAPKTRGPRMEEVFPQRA